MKLFLIFVTASIASISVHAQQVQKSAKQDACEKLKKYYESAEATSKLPTPNKPGSPTELDKVSKNKAFGQANKYQQIGDKVIGTLDKTAKFVELLFKNKMGPLTQTMALTKQAFGLLGTVSAFLGPVGAGVGALLSIIAMFIPQPDPIDELKKEMREGFAKMNERFNDLEKKMNEMIVVIQSTAIYIEYQKQNAKLAYVMAAYQSFVLNPNNITRNELLRNCNQYSPKNVIIWIKTTGTNPIGPALLATIVKDKQYDLAKIEEWFQVIIIDVLRATFLREVCYSVDYGENTDLKKFASKTKQDDLVGMPTDPAMCEVRNDQFEAFENDRKEIENFVADILIHISRIEWNVKSNLDKEQLQKDLDTHLKTYEAVLKNANGVRRDRHPAYCNLVRDIKMSLDKKYFWLNWGVHLSKSSEDGFKSLGASHYLQHQKEGKMLFVIWSEKDSPMTELAEQKAETLRKAEDVRLDKLDKTMRSISNEAEKKTKVEELSKSIDEVREWFGKFWVNDEQAIVGSTSSKHREHVDMYDHKYSLYDNRVASISYSSFKMLCQLQHKYIPNSYHSDTFTVYYDTRDLANTLACKGTYVEIKQALDKDNSTRQQHCSLSAFKTVTQNVIYFYFNKNEKAGTDLKNKNYNKVGAGLNAHLDKKFEDIEWNVLIIGDGAKVTRTSDDCKKSSRNCLMFELIGHGHSLYIIWTSKESKLKQSRMVPKEIRGGGKKIKEVIKNEFDNFKIAKNSTEVLDHAISFLTNHANYTKHNKPNSESSRLSTGIMHQLDKYKKISVVTTNEIYPPFEQKISNAIRFKFEQPAGVKYYVKIFFYKFWDD